MSQATTDMDVLHNPESIRILANVLKTNVAACTSIGSFFLPQIARIYMDMLGLYRAVSGIISELVAKDGQYFCAFKHEYTSSQACFVYFVIRAHCDEDPEGSWPSDCEEGNLEARGDVYQEGGRPGGGEHQLHPTITRRRPRRLQSQCPYCSRCRGVECCSHHRHTAWSTPPGFSSILRHLLIGLTWYRTCSRHKCHRSWTLCLSRR